MRVIDISKFGESLVLHLETDSQRINAYTLASMLVSIADAAKAANTAVNAGYDVEIAVEALGPGSFRATIRAIYASTRNLFSDQRLQAVVLSILASFIYERTLSVDESVKVEIHSDEVIVQSGDDRIIVPRSVYDATRKAERSPAFTRAITRTLNAIMEDEKVAGLGFVEKMESPAPEIVISRDAIQQIGISLTDEPLTRTVEEQCSLLILKAILKKSRRKWEFVWRGVKISAPILDDEFFSRFSSHEVTIAPGDELEVRLRMKQERDTEINIYTNVGYEVVEVINHVPQIRQEPLNYPT